MFSLTSFDLDLFEQQYLTDSMFRYDVNEFIKYCITDTTISVVYSILGLSVIPLLGYLVS